MNFTCTPIHFLNLTKQCEKSASQRALPAHLPSKTGGRVTSTPTLAGVLAERRRLDAERRRRDPGTRAEIDTPVGKQGFQRGAKLRRKTDKIKAVTSAAMFV